MTSRYSRRREESSAAFGRRDGRAESPASSEGIREELLQARRAGLNINERVSARIVAALRAGDFEEADWLLENLGATEDVVRDFLRESLKLDVWAALSSRALPEAMGRGDLLPEAARALRLTELEAAVWLLTNVPQTAATQARLLKAMVRGAWGLAVDTFRQVREEAPGEVNGPELFEPPADPERYPVVAATFWEADPYAPRPSSPRHPRLDELERWLRSVGWALATNARMHGREEFAFSPTEAEQGTLGGEFADMDVFAIRVEAAYVQAGRPGVRRAPALLQAPRPDADICVIDIETTGLSSRTDRVLEIAAAVFRPDASEILGWSTLIREPDVPILNSDVHGITPEMVEAEGVPLRTAFDQLEETLRGMGLVVGHNAVAFDIPFLLLEAAQVGHPLAVALGGCPRRDTLVMARRLGFKPADLSSVYEGITGEPIQGAHRALADVRACARCYFWLAAHLEGH